MQKAATDGEQVALDRPQRFSTTSGEGQAPTGKRTWTVGDVDDGETHRGGKNTKKKVRGKRPGRELRLNAKEEAVKSKVIERNQLANSITSCF